MSHVSVLLLLKIKYDILDILEQMGEKKHRLVEILQRRVAVFVCYNKIQIMKSLASRVVGKCRNIDFRTIEIRLGDKINGKGF